VLVRTRLALAPPDDITLLPTGLTGLRGPTGPTNPANTKEGNRANPRVNPGSGGGLGERL
jgi:hypothetical protein